MGSRWQNVPFTAKRLRHGTQAKCVQGIHIARQLCERGMEHARKRGKNNGAIPPTEAHALHGEAMPEGWVEAVGAGVDTMVISCAHRGTSRQPVFLTVPGCSTVKGKVKNALCDCWCTTKNIVIMRSCGAWSTSPYWLARDSPTWGAKGLDH